MLGSEFFLNNDPTRGPKLAGRRLRRRRPRRAGGAGNDWLVGGTGRDTLEGGDGDDLLNGDDDLSTNGGLNLENDPDPSYADVLNGGAGRDVFLTNNVGDRVNGAGGEDSAEPNVLGGSPQVIVRPIRARSTRDPAGDLGARASTRRSTSRRRRINAAAQKARPRRRPTPRRRS